MITPFRKDGSIDFKCLESLINFYIKGGVEYLVVLGTTGEPPVLNKDEKQAIVSLTVEVVNNRVPVVLGMGGNNTHELTESLKNANLEGIDALLSVTPYYNKPNQEGLFQHFRSIAMASPLPLIVYNVPGRTGSNISPETAIRLAKQFKQQIIGIKEASGNLSQVMNIIKDKPKEFFVTSGDDALAFALTSLGGTGVISVIGNAFPAEFSEMIRNVLKGDLEEARKLHYKLLPAMNWLLPRGALRVLKLLWKSWVFVRITCAYLWCQ